MARAYEYIEHTADLGIRAYGRDPAELFEHVALAMFETIATLQDIAERVERSIDCEADTLEDLMVCWLGELLYMFDVEKLVFRRFEVAFPASGRIQARAWGDLLDPGRRQVKSVIKAVTYHQLYVREKGGVWEAQVIFDV